MTQKLLDGKVAAITGGATGIGRAIAVEYLAQGAKVTVNHLDDQKSREAYESLLASIPEAQKANLYHISGDVSKAHTATRLVEETASFFGKLDVFVSNAGVCKFEDFLAVDRDLFENTVAINLSGAFYGCQAAAKQMVKQGHGGSIIGVSSISALVGGAQQVHYTPTKSGILSLMQSCACALGKYDIRCNALLPGTIRTQLNEQDLADDEKKQYMEKRTPLGRVGVPSDMAGPAVFLASEMSAYMTGSQLLVDGG